MISRRATPVLVAELAFLTAAVLVQQGMVSFMAISGVHPDIVLLLVMNWSILRGMEEGMLWGLVGGVMVDMVSGLPFGTSAAAYVVVAGLAGLFARAFSRGHLLLPLLAAALATLVYYAVCLVIVSSEENRFLLTASFESTVVGVAIFNVAISAFVFWAASILDGRLRPVARTVV